MSAICSVCKEWLLMGHAQVATGRGLAHCGCYAMADAKPTDLELLVIDLGDSCVVKVEKGNFDMFMPESTLRYYGQQGSVVNTRLTFAELRSAIEGDKPVPRIERHVDNDQNFDGYQIIFPAKVGGVDYVTTGQYNALSQLAGKPLPIYTGGTWEQLATTNGVTIWKFTR